MFRKPRNNFLKFSIYGATHPRRGDVVEGEIPLTPLLNVGRSNLSSANVCGEFASDALKALYDREFYLSNIAGSGPIGDAKVRNAGSYRRHILEQLAETPADGSGCVLKAVSGAAAMYARYFAVLKEPLPPSARAIFDARTFNEWCKPPPSFHLVYPEMVLRLLSKFGTRKVMFYSADLVNMYYQIKIGNHLGTHMALMLDGTTYLPLVLPMGWSWSCYIAQALTFGLILKEYPGDEDLGIPREILLKKTPPAFVEMRDGTTVMVIYDTICVIGSPEMAKKWKSRIERNMNLAQLVLKYSKIGSSVDFDGMTLTSTANGTSWRIQDDTRDAWVAWAKEVSHSSALHLWKGLGFLRFAAPIVGLHVAHLAYLTEEQAAFAATSPLLTRKDYCLPNPALTDAVQVVTAMIQKLNFEERHRRSHMRGLGRRWFAVTDATLRHESFCFCDEGDDGVKRFRQPEIRPSPEQTTDVMDTEAAALTWCIQVWAAKAAENDVLFVLGDNQPVIRSFYKLRTMHQATATCIDLVRSILLTRKIIFGDIKSDDNYGDIGSRPDEMKSEAEIEHRRARSIEKFNEMSIEFDQFGTGLHMRKRDLLDDSDDEMDSVPSDPDDDDDKSSTRCVEPVKRRRLD